MKTSVKKVLSLMLTLVMAFSLAVPAFAAEDERTALDAAAAAQATTPTVQSKPAAAVSPTVNAATNPDVPYRSDDFDFDLADIDI